MTRGWIIRTLLLAACLGPGTAAVPAAAQTPPAAAHLTLQQAVDEALVHAPALAADAARERAARWKATSIERTRFGQIDGLASFTRYQDDIILRAMSKQLFGATGFAGLPFAQDQALYGVTFQAPLYLGGRLTAAIDIARLQANELTLAAESTRWELRANVTALYAGIQTFDAVDRALDENLQALDATRRAVALMVAEGRRAGVDLLKLDEQIQEVRAERSRVAADAARTRALLLALMGRDPSLPLEVDPLPSRPPGPVPSVAELASEARVASPVRRATLAVAEARRAVDQAEAALRPSLVVRGNWLGHAAPSTAALSTWEVGVAVTMPLFDGGSRHAAVAAAREAERAAASALDRARLDRAAQAVSALADLASAQARIEAAEAGVAAGVETARIEQVRYDAGAGTIDDVLRARARELAARAALARARGSRVAAAARVNTVAEREVVP